MAVLIRFIGFHLLGRLETGSYFGHMPCFVCFNSLGRLETNWERFIGLISRFQFS